ncbi:MAG: tyrosine--tRNA ligase [Candidatus Sungbacteria bacterium]|nr:tyrosine--tRNA ligase [Candidatus Sungbacteria bacterium]
MPKLDKSRKDIVAEILTRNTADVIERKSLLSKLQSGRKLRIKLGADPTSPDLHLGHAVVLRALRKLQDTGHTIVFIIGDFTAMIGDPSGRSAARRALSGQEIKKNAKTYFQQVGRVLNLKKTEVHYNSMWLSKLGWGKVLELNALFTVSRILERDDFKNRLGSGNEVWMHELQYPILQAYDSVAIKADIEVGGTDQLFNLLVGRHLMERLGLAGQDVITFEILPGLDGKEKMSKSLGNYIALTDSPEKMFGKVMSLPDSAIPVYFKLATERAMADIRTIERRIEGGENPRDVKIELAREIVSLYHGGAAAEKARAEFVRVFSKKELPREMDEREMKPGSYEAAALLLDLGLSKSRSEAWRLILAGAVEVTPHRGVSQKVMNPRELVPVSPDTVIRVGRMRFIRIR